MAVDEHKPAEPPRRKLSCKACTALIARFVEGGMLSVQREAMLEHVRGCDSCAEAYGQSLRSAASLGRVRRERRLKEQAKVRRRSNREMALSATGGGRSKSRAYQLRLILLPALFALLVIQFNRSPDRGTRVSWEHGMVQAAGASLDSDLAEVRIGKGTWCVTGPDSQARLESGGTVLRLGSATTLRMESAFGAPRVRLQAGHLVVQGEATISTFAGIFRSEPKTSGRMAWENGAFVVTCDRGVIEASGPEGIEAISAGSVRTFELIR